MTSKMKLLYRLGGILNLLVLTSIVWNINSISAQASCQATVDAVAREIRKKGTTVDVHLDRKNYNQELLANKTRIGYIGFILNTKLRTDREGDVAANILHSKVLMKNYSSRVFRNCGGTGYINFGMNGTDWVESFGMTDKNTLAYHICSKKRTNFVNQISSSVEDQMSGYCAWIIPEF